jgi:hypothetical protein
MKTMRWLTGVAAWAFGRGRARRRRGDAAREAGGLCGSEAAFAHGAIRRAEAERDAMRRERDRWRGEAEREAGAAARVRFDGYAQAEADIAAWLRATYSGSSRIADCVGRGDHRPGDRSVRSYLHSSAAPQSVRTTACHVRGATDCYCGPCAEARTRPSLRWL